MATPARYDPDRLFVRDGWRHYRRSYSLAEVRWGGATLVGLLLITGWVAWKGAHPDPRLYGAGAPLPGASAVAVVLPGDLEADDLVSEGWKAGEVSRFDEDNLYVKINGRADYFISFGFEALYSVALLHGEDSATSVDIELYDLGEAANALGAYAGERGEAAAETDDAGLGHIARNALLMTHGRYYLRAIGSDENETVVGQLRRLRQVLRQKLPSEPLPWAYALFVGRMGVDAGKIGYAAENAFSFEFGRDVYTAKIGRDETVAFVVMQPDEATAEQLARRFAEGFAELGRVEAEADGVTWVADRYLNTLAGARAAKRWVIGVRGAPDLEAAQATLAKLERALMDLPSEVRERARPREVGSAQEETR